jgi:hypothetical protein
MMKKDTILLSVISICVGLYADRIILGGRLNHLEASCSWSNQPIAKGMENEGPFVLVRGIP